MRYFSDEMEGSRGKDRKGGLSFDELRGTPISHKPMRYVRITRSRRFASLHSSYLLAADTAKERELSQWRRSGSGLCSAENADGPSSFLPNHSQASPFNITFQYCLSAFSVLLYLSSPTRRRHGPSRATTRMPRRKAADPPAPKRRSRNGCVNCRRRKIRCDEGSPSCGYCRARSLTCSRGGVVLKWEADYADNGLAFGRQGVGPAAGSQG